MTRRRVLTVGLHHLILNDDRERIFDRAGFRMPQRIFNVFSIITHAPFELRHSDLVDFMLHRKRLSLNEIPRINRLVGVHARCNEFLRWWLQILREVLGEPGVFSNFANGDSVDRVNLEHGPDEPGSPRRDVSRNMKSARCDLLEKGGDVVIVKRQSTHQQHIEDYTAAPHINLGSRVQLSRNHLRSGIVGTATAGLQEIAIRHDIAQPEIGDLDVLLAVDQQVLWFQVAVNDLVSVAVFDGADDLLKELAGLVIVASPLSHQVIE